MQMKFQQILGIDPGVSGGAAFISEALTGAQTIAFSKVTPSDICAWLVNKKIDMCYLEAVHSMPAQGVASTFKFGKNAGWWEGVLMALEIPFQRVYPLKWQTFMSCRTGGNKNVSKARAQELFPRTKVTHAIADALLIAEYGRRQSRPNASDL